MLQNILLTIAGVIIFLFIFWERLKEDYVSEIIFTVSFYILIGVLVGWLISKNFAPDWFFWINIVTVVAGLYIGILRFRIKFFESFESVVIGFLPWLSFIFLSDSVSHSSLSSFIAFALMLVFIFIFYFLETHYREFTWYRSGKVGFSGLATLSSFFFVRVIVSLMGVEVLSFVCKYEPIISGIGAFICLILLYNLSKKKE